jgi:hypothetical protein
LFQKDKGDEPLGLLAGDQLALVNPGPRRWNHRLVSNRICVSGANACTMRDVTEIAPVPGVAYSAHCDPSSGQQDSFTLAIGHVEGEIAILDYLYERRPPFSPASIVAEVCDVLGRYAWLRALATGMRKVL